MELRGKLKLPAKICERRDDGWEVSKERDGGLAGGGAEGRDTTKDCEALKKYLCSNIHTQCMVP